MPDEPIGLYTQEYAELVAEVVYEKLFGKSPMYKPDFTPEQGNKNQELVLSIADAVVARIQNR